MTTVVGPIGSACIADSDRVRSMLQVPEKSGRDCACAGNGSASEQMSSADRTLIMTALLDRSQHNTAARSPRVGFGVVPAIGLRPCREALAQPRRARVLAGHAMLFVRIGREVVQLVGSRAKIEDVLPIALADS